MCAVFLHNIEVMNNFLKWLFFILGFINKLNFHDNFSSFFTPLWEWSSNSQVLIWQLYHKSKKNWFIISIQQILIMSLLSKLFSWYTTHADSLIKAHLHICSRSWLLWWSRNYYLQSPQVIELLTLFFWTFFLKKYLEVF